MPSTINIYPTTDLYHIRTNDTSSDARNAASSTTIVDNFSELAIASYIDSGLLTYKRTYLEFDVSSLVGNFVTGITLYGEYSDIVSFGTPAPVAVYAGTGSLNGSDNTQYSLYLDNGIPIAENPSLVRQWGELTKPSKFDPQTFSAVLDLEVYQVDPADGNIVIGIVSQNDSTNVYPVTTQQELIYPTGFSGGGVVLPYIEVTYAAAGYANVVMGIPGANITTVSGVPAGDIANIMGV